MNRLDEKRLLAMMMRGSGTPDLQLEEELKQLGVTNETPMQIKDTEISDELVREAAASISAKRKDGGLSNPVLPNKLHGAELESIRSQLTEVMQRMNTMAWGGGGTGIVRMSEADDVQTSLMANGDYVRYVGGEFIGGVPDVGAQGADGADGAQGIQGTDGAYAADFTGVNLNALTLNTSNIILTNTYALTGIKVDLDEPEYPWHDLLGQIDPKFTGAGAPLRKLYKDTNIYDYAFALNDACDFVFHIPHDYVPNSNLYLHVHWSHNAPTSISGNAQFTFSYVYAKGHNQENFSTERNLILTVPTVDIATTPRYRHRIDEGQIAAPTANTQAMPSANVEVDGLIIGQLKLTEHPSLGGAGSPSVFIHMLDIHYQSTNVGTKARKPNFWSGPTDP